MSSPQIPTEQWAQVIEKTGGPVEYKKIPVQKPGPDEVLVNIKFSGVCHTDLHAVNGFALLTLPRSRSLADAVQETGPCRPNCRSLVATRVPVSSSPAVSS